MRVYNMQGFDKRANIVLNEAVRLASKRFNCENITTVHLLISLLAYEQIVSKFETYTGVTREEFISREEKAYSESKKELGIDTSASNTEYVRELGIDNLSDEARKVLAISLDKARITNNQVTIDDLFYQVMLSNERELWRLFPDGTQERVRAQLYDPLKSMPETSRHAVCMNKLAKDGMYDPIEGRDKEIDAIIEVLGRRVKNNPCVVGDPGVGKTAIVQGLAQRIVDGNVPSYMRNKFILSVDVTSIVSGTKFRGDFEERMNRILNEAARTGNVILFFDEMHMLIEAGSSSDSAMTASNILKPAISHGDVQIIGATTTKEYRRFIEKDKAFERRIERINIGEPSIELAEKMVHATIDKYNEFHNSTITDAAIHEAVVLSDRYIPEKKLPDKAITLIDETAARLKKYLKTGESFEITASDVKDTISKLTNIDVGDLDDTARSKLKNLSDNLHHYVIGQDSAVTELSKAIKRSRTGIKDPNKPAGSFLFVGPTGVGKTELTKALAIELYGSTKELIRFDMSEFMEKHSVSKMIGSPPGYVGYGEGGQLTEAVRRKPNSIILFDEIEKAHPDVFNVLLQVLDDGQLTDSEGNRVDFKNTIIIMTSNAGYGADMMNKGKIGFSSGSNTVESDRKEKIALESLESTFRPEFLNRLDKIIIFEKLTMSENLSITELLLKQLKKRVRNAGISIQWTEDAVKVITELGYSEKYGARNIKRKVQELVEDRIADLIVDEEIAEGDTVIIDEHNGEIEVSKQIMLSGATEVTDTEVVCSV